MAPVFTLKRRVQGYSRFQGTGAESANPQWDVKCPILLPTLEIPSIQYREALGVTDCEVSPIHHLPVECKSRNLSKSHFSHL